MNAGFSLQRLAARPQVGAYSDIALAFGVVAVVGLMILPLPTPIIDALIAVNMSIGVALLLIAIYIPSPVAFSSFPSVLLISTLFRLSLAIATTRLVLLEADAGHIIETFGKLVVGGNLVVGLVVFVIITVVQFIVIAKGAERVAEVAARFTLDAMPGKQLSIDSDLRSGLVDKDEAKRRRKHLEIESQLYGALDGAMKFVKGDAIAGIVIIIVNLLGGLAVGVMQHDMSLGEAGHVYSILTIGDGLVMQIPALLAAIAAGLVVTRTASEVQDRHLGEAIRRQVTAHPRVLLITGAVALLLAAVPGFPGLVFAPLGIALLIAGTLMSPQRTGLVARLFPHSREQVQAQQKATSTEPEFAAAAPLIIELAPPDHERIDLQGVEGKLTQLRTALYHELGVVFPLPRVLASNEVSAGRYRLRIYDVPTATGALERGDVSIEALAATLRKHAAQFLGIQEVNGLIGKLAAQYPDLIKEMLRVVPLQKVADVLRRLAEENVSIRNLRDIFESLAESGQREKDVVLLAEHARIGLKRYLSARYADGERALQALLLHPDLEDRIRQSVRIGNGGTQLALDPEIVSRMIANLRAHRTAQTDRASTPAAVLTSLDVRRYVRKLIEKDFFEVPVLSYHELAPEITVRPIAQLNA
jgi:type III secretion protein V